MAVTIGNHIESLRNARKYSGRKLGLLSGVSHATINRIENGIIRPSPDTLQKLAGPLGANYQELLSIAGYLDSGNCVPENIRILRQHYRMSPAEMSSDIWTETGEAVPENVIEALEAGKTVAEFGRIIDIIAKYAGVSVGFFFKENSAADLENAMIHEPYIQRYDSKNLTLKHLEDDGLLEWVRNPANLDYIVFARRLSDLGIDPEFVFEEFVSKIFKPKKPERK